MHSITLFGVADSTYLRTATLACELKGLAYRVRRLHLRSPAHARLHPFMKLPAAQIGDQPLFETLAIVSYLDEMPGVRPLQPVEPRRRALMLQWISAANDYLYRDLVLRPSAADVGVRVLLPVARDLVLLNRALGSRGYFCGEALSLADLFIFPMLLHCRTKLAHFDLLLRRQRRLQRWFDQMQAIAALRHNSRT